MDDENLWGELDADVTASAKVATSEENTAAKGDNSSDAESPEENKKERWLTAPDGKQFLNTANGRARLEHHIESLNAENK